MEEEMKKERKTGDTGESTSSPLTPRKIVKTLQAAEAMEVLSSCEPQITKLDIYRVLPGSTSRAAFVKRVAWDDVKEESAGDIPAFLENRYGGGHFTVKIMQGKDELGRTELDVEGPVKNRNEAGGLWGDGSTTAGKKKEEEILSFGG